MVESACNAGRPRFNSWVGKICWRRDRLLTLVFLGFSFGSVGKESTCRVETWVLSLGWEDPLEKGMATHSSILAWRIPWTLEPMVSQRIGHDCVTFTGSSCSTEISKNKQMHEKRQETHQRKRPACRGLHWQYLRHFGYQI